MNIHARTEKGEIKRVADLRSSRPIESGKNYGYAKGKEMEQSRFVYRKHCQFCGVEFEGISTAKYDSESCKQKAKRFRKNAAISEHPV